MVDARPSVLLLCCLFHGRECAGDGMSEPYTGRMTIQPHSPWMYQHLRANNDVNGNPRRCFVIYDYDANIIDVIDEGYVGRPKWVSALRQLATLDIGVSEYKNLLKMAAKWEES
jgi:hypothetical protein